MITLEKLVETRRQVSDTMHTAYVALLGNRVTAAAYISAFNLFCGFSSGFMNSPVYAILSVAAAIGIVPHLGDTYCGANTLKFYKRTTEHIRAFGYLDERFVKKVMDTEQNEGFYGYCEQQGVYLAAEHEGQTAVFRKVQKEHSRVKIPFF